MLERPGNIYLGLLQMCVIPIIISAIILSIGNLLKSNSKQSYIFKLIAVFITGMIISAAIALFIGLIGKPGAGLSKEQKALMGKEILRVESAQDASVSCKNKKQIIDFIEEMIPTNIFRAVSEGKILPILFFCIIMGVALGTLRNENRETVLSFANASYEALLNIISWIMYGLPFGLCALFAFQISQIGTDIFVMMFKLILLIYISSILLIIFYSIIIWLRSGGSFISTVLTMRRVLIVSIGTSSSFAAIPFALESLHKKLRFEKETTDLIIPLGITINPHGNILYFALAGIFMTQIYTLSLTPQDYITIILSAILAGVAASSAPGLAAISMIAIVIEPFGLPVMVGIILLAAIDPLVDPIITAVNVYGNCATVSLTARKI